MPRAVSIPMHTPTDSTLELAMRLVWPDLTFPPINLWNAPVLNIWGSPTSQPRDSGYQGKASFVENKTSVQLQTLLKRRQA